MVRDTGDGCAITVRVTPRSSRAGVTVGTDHLSIRVHAAPTGGKATEEAARRLADALGVSRSRVRLGAGARHRIKTFRVAGVTAAAARRALRSG